MKVIVPSEYGFCGGVRTALQKADDAIAEAGRRGEPCCLYGSIVHNRIVSASFERRRVRIIGSPDEAESGFVVIRTHGIADDKRKALEDKGLSIVDATCPVVLRSMALARDAEGPVLIIGKRGHSEIESLQGARPDAAVIESPEDLRSLPSGTYSAVVQTTLSLSLLDRIREEARRLGITLDELNSICMASERRRSALLSILPDVDAVVVAGDEESANSRELRDLAVLHGKPSYLALDASALPGKVFSFRTIGLTAGASTPDEVFSAMKRALESA